MKRAYIWLAVFMLLAACAPAVPIASLEPSPSALVSHPPSPSPSPVPSPSPSPPPSPSPAPSPSPSPSPPPSPSPEPPAPYLVLAVGGDVAMEYKPGVFMKTGAWDRVLDAEVVARFCDADGAIVNLETSVSRRGEPEPKTFTYRTDPENLLYLRDHLGVDVVSLANNHTLDFGLDAFTDTLDHLDEYGLGRVGGGRTLAEAQKPFVIESQGRTVAVFGASQVAPNGRWYAKEDRPGLLMAYNPKQICDAVKTAKEHYDFVIVYLHWGDERVTEPEELQTNAARKIIDAGADAVIGSHPHVVQTFELYKNRPIAYSLGNFLFNINEPHSAAAYIHLKDDCVRMEIEPLIFSNGTAVKPSAGQRKELLQIWGDRSPGIVFDDEGFLTAET